MGRAGSMGRAAAGPDAAARFAAFVAASGPDLLRLGMYLTTDTHTAEDLVQTALVKAYVSWRRVESAGSPLAYVRRIMVNTATDEHRRRVRRPAEQHISRERAALQDVSSEVTSVDNLRRMLAVLPARQRAVLALRFGSDLSEAETAEVLGLSLGTVKSHTSRALSRLRAWMEEQSDVDSR